MITFKIKKPNTEIESYLQDKIDSLTKPKGSLGMLETLAKQIGKIQQTLSPSLNNPHHIIFAADHGIVDEGVSPSPKEVTYQMIINFQQGGAGINFLAKQHNIKLEIVDTGVDYDFPANNNQIINKKIQKGTNNYLYGAAMSYQQADQALKNGADCTEMCYKRGCNIISFGEMGITNTSSSALWISCLTKLPLKKCVGAGCDHTGDIINHKYNVLRKSLENYKRDNSIFSIMSYFGGFEMVTTIGAMLKAAELGMVIIIDGYIMTACALMASKLDNNFLEYCIFGHTGDEQGHKLVLDFMGVKPILNLGFRLGEGTGALCSYPIIDSSVRMINEMNSFKKIEVTKYF